MKLLLVIRRPDEQGRDAETDLEDAGLHLRSFQMTADPDELRTGTDFARKS